jgi:hypothetical protein
MRTLVTIMAHKEAQEIFERHFPLWWDLGHELLVVYPKRSRVLIPMPRGKQERQVMQLEVGEPAHSGIESIVRFRTILEQMHGMGFDRYAFFEYDALCFGPLPEMRGDVAGNLFRDDSPNRGFIGTCFVHPPLMFTHKGLEMVVNMIRQMKLTDEKSVWDRFLGLCLERIGIERNVHNFLATGEGISRNTWEPAEYPELKKAVRSGVSMIHGLKSKEALAICMEGSRLWQNKLELQREGMI